MTKPRKLIPYAGKDFATVPKEDVDMRQRRRMRELVAAGRTYEEISETLNIAVSTVKRRLEKERTF